MKRILLFSLLFVCGALTALAAPWGGHAGDDIEVKETQTDNRFHILRKVVAGKPINIYLMLDMQEVTPRMRKGYEDQLRATYQDWANATKYFVSKTGKEKNFTQVLGRLQKMQVQFVSVLSQADLKVFITDNRDLISSSCSGAEGIDLSIEACISRTEKIPVFYMPSYSLMLAEFKQREWAEKREISQEMKDAYFDKVMWHEIGHTLGLADQYREANPNVRAHVMYRSTHVREGIMNGAWTITCDDADGIVNLIDVIAGVEPNRKQGWPSLCPDSPDVYVKGVAKGTGPYVFKTENDKWFLITYKDGKKWKEETLIKVPMANPFVPVPAKRVLQRDGLERPVRAEGPGKEIIFYEYNYATSSRLITQGNKVLRAELQSDEEVYNQRTRKMQKQRFVNWSFKWPNGQEGELLFLADPEGYGGEYREGGSNPSFQINVDKSRGYKESVRVDGKSNQPGQEKLVEQVKAWVTQQYQRWEQDNSPAGSPRE